jgi:hypothetical protein
VLLGENKSKDGVAHSLLRNGTKCPQEFLLPMKSLRATSPCWVNLMRFDYALVQNIYDPATIFLFSTPGVNMTEINSNVASATAPHEAAATDCYLRLPPPDVAIDCKDRPLH